MEIAAKVTEEGLSDSDIERAMIHVLEPLRKDGQFDELVSMTNDYNQTLAHFASLTGYFKLLKRLVEWNTDLTIADVNGLTPLHCAYRGGCSACVELLLDAGASETVLDALGRTPAGSIPDRLRVADGRPLSR
jgi:ankyrin repeat protein